MRIVALDAVRRCERLILMGLLQVGVLRIMAIEAERRGRFSKVKPVVHRGLGAGLVRHVARIAA